MRGATRGEPGTYLWWRGSQLRTQQTMAVYVALSRQVSHTKSLILRNLILLAASYPRGFATRRAGAGKVRCLVSLYIGDTRCVASPNLPLRLPS